MSVVAGLSKFKEAMAGHEDSCVLIGGGACSKEKGSIYYPLFLPAGNHWRRGGAGRTAAETQTV